MNYFLTANTPTMRLLRTIVQAVIGVLIANIDTLIGQTVIAPEIKPVIVALVIAVLTPVMAEIGKMTDKAEDNK